jgi:hypothetical protein
MDFGLIGGVNPPDAAFEPARYVMGDTLRFAERINLIAMQPRDDITSTRFALTSLGEEYLILQPSDQGGPVHGHAEAGKLLRRVVQHRWPHDGSPGADDRPQCRRNTFQRVPTGAASGRPVLDEGPGCGAGWWLRHWAQRAPCRSLSAPA